MVQCFCGQSPSVRVGKRFYGKQLGYVKEIWVECPCGMRSPEVLPDFGGTRKEAIQNWDDRLTLINYKWFSGGVINV